MKRIITFNMLQYLINFFKLCVLCMILVSDGYYGADYQYEACVPRNCGDGPNISFPFYIAGLQESYCGFPGFALNCNQGSPVLRLSENEYVVEDIFYGNTSFHVYDSAVPSSKLSRCPRISNTTLPAARQFAYANSVTMLHLLSNCSDSLPGNLEPLKVYCDFEKDINKWVLAIYDNDSRFKDALENCARNVIAPVESHVIAPVESHEYVGNNRQVTLVEVLRRGFVLNWTASDCRPCEDSGGRCGFSETSFHFRCFCPDRPHSRSCIPLRKNRSLILTLGSGFGAVLLVTSILILLILTKRKMMKNALNDKNMEVILKQYGNLAPRRYKYSELKKMTKSFSDNLGKGGYGSVYKAKSKDGRLLAVKILNESKNNGEEFINEVASISRTSHVNIVTLLGFCFEGSKRALVYEFMPNRSLDKFIGNTCLSAAESRLGWGKLFEISVGIARGLEYLHRGCHMQILHFDIKPHNILLDKDFQPKISDFGLAKLCPNRASMISMSGTRGTIGYIAPEVFCRNFGKVSHKSDVYSYGMMMLEIVGERENNDRAETHQTSELYFPHWIYKHLESNNGQNLDDVIDHEDECRLTKRKLTIVGLWCIQTDPKDRPSMSKVVEMLEGKLESLPIPPKPYLSSPTRPAVDASFSGSNDADSETAPAQGLTLS